MITLLFLDFTGAIHLWFGWLARIQLVPAVLAGSALIIVAISLFTLLFGRLYCSVICPLGILQDGISHIAGRRKKNRFGYVRATSWLRYGLLAIFILAIVLGVGIIVSLLDPYAAYGRIAANMFTPLYRLGNNLLAYLAETVDGYAFYSTDVWLKGWATFGIAAATLLVVGVLSWRRGRTYCNTICPVGTILGVLSRVSIFKIRFDGAKCKNCGLCARNCKSSCIDHAAKTVDHSRCVACFNCIDACKSGGIKYGLSAKKMKHETVEAQASGLSRRHMFSMLGAFAVANTLKAQQVNVDGGLADIADKKVPQRKTPIVPAGAEGIKHFDSHCTACQLCVSACPNNVLRPSGKLSRFMQPEMSYEKGYCRPECVECSLVCPTAAIRPVDAARKSVTAIGRAVWVEKNCVVNTDKVPCDICESHCPATAIVMLKLDPQDNKSLKRPTVDTELCIGCGACEHLCPARPFSAIYVEGNERHHEIW